MSPRPKHGTNVITPLDYSLHLFGIFPSVRVHICSSLFSLHLPPCPSRWRWLLSNQHNTAALLCILALCSMRPCGFRQSNPQACARGQREPMNRFILKKPKSTWAFRTASWTQEERIHPGLKKKKRAGSLKRIREK